MTTAAWRQKKKPPAGLAAEGEIPHRKVTPLSHITPRIVIVALLLITPACGSTVGPRDESHDPQQPFVMPPLVDASGHPLPDLQQGRDWR